jgi:hypothetical protein
MTPNAHPASARELSCVFVPANEPWSCSVHPAGYRTALDQTECSIVLGEGTLEQLGRDIRSYGDYRAKRAVAAERARLREAVEAWRGDLQRNPAEEPGPFTKGYYLALDEVLLLLDPEAPR